jgi:hypothetical protein
LFGLIGQGSADLHFAVGVLGDACDGAGVGVYQGGFYGGRTNVVAEEVHGRKNAVFGGEDAKYFLRALQRNCSVEKLHRMVKILTHRVNWRNFALICPSQRIIVVVTH